MKSIFTLIISLNLIVSPYAAAFERTNLVGIDETTENFQDTSNGGGGNSGTSRTAGPRGGSGRTSNPGTSRGSTSAGSTTTTAQTRQCAPGEIYNRFSNKCMGSEESRRIKAEAENMCDAISDSKLKASCVEDRVNEAISRAENNGEMTQHSSKASKISLLPLILAFGTIYAGVSHLKDKKGGCPGATSSYLMIGGSVTIIATEIMTKLAFSKQLKESQKKLKALSEGSASKDSDNKNATNLQEEIFQALIDRENGVIKAAEGKKKGYSLAKLMFAAATVAAGIEIFKYATMKANPTTSALAAFTYICKDGDFTNFTPKELPTNSFDYLYSSLYTPHDHIEYILKTLVSNLTLYPTAFAIPPEIIADPEIVVTAKKKKKLFVMPVTRLVLAGLMTGVTATLSGHANKEIDNAKKRIEVLEKLKSQVSEAGPAVKCANGTEQGTAGCKQVVPTTVKPGESTFGLAKTQANGSANTNRSSSFTSAKGCASKNGQADPDCGCKKTNSCFSINSDLKIGDSPAGNILGSGINDINALTSGTISPVDLDAAALGKQLAAAGKMRDKMLSDLNKDPKLATEIKKAQEAMNGMQRQMFNTMPANAGAAASSLALTNDSDMSGMSGNQVLDQVKAELQEASAPTVTNEAVAGSGESDFNFDIGTADPMNVGTGLTEGEGTANTNIDDFELAESEINPSSTTNIFEIVSSRYKKSAYMRLLKADKEITPEAPASKEIND